MRGWIRVAAAVPPLHAADPQANAEEIRQVLKEADERGADVVVFPSCALTGATLGDLFCTQTLQSATQEALDEVVEASRNTRLTLVLSIVDGTQAKAQERIVVIQNGTCIEDSRFRLMNRYDGSLLCRCTVASLSPVSRVRMSDLAQEKNADLLLLPAAIPAQVGGTKRLAQEIKALSARGAGVVLACAGEEETGIDTFYAGDRLLAENGRLVADGGTLGRPSFFYGGVGSQGSLPDEVIGESAIYYDFDLDAIAAEHEEGEVPEEEVASLVMAPRRRAQWSHVDSMPFVVKTEEECEEILQIQARAMARRMRHVKTRQVWIGLSGGLDSTLAFLVALRTFALCGWDTQGIHLVSMPAFGTGKRTRNNAAALGERSGCDFREISLTPVLTRHFQDIGLQEGDHSVAFENAQARERTQILMDLANLQGGLHVGTGDFSESALGWCTFNGDHMAMFNVNGSIPKTLVQALVAYEANNLPTLAAILKDILETPISPELLPGKEGEIVQKTEEVIGPYVLHDFYLYHFLRFHYAPDKLFALAQKAFRGTYSTATLLFVLRKMFSRFFASQFKRSVMPDGISVGALSLSPRGGWRMPSDVQASAWLMQVDRLQEEEGDA